MCAIAYQGVSSKGGTCSAGSLWAHCAGSQVMKQYKNFIDGQWAPAESGDTFTNSNPADTREEVAEYAKGGKADAKAAREAVLSSDDEVEFGDGAEVDLAAPVKVKKAKASGGAVAPPIWVTVLKRARVEAKGRE